MGNTTPSTLAPASGTPAYRTPTTGPGAPPAGQGPAPGPDQIAQGILGFNAWLAGVAPEGPTQQANVYLPGNYGANQAGFIPVPHVTYTDALNRIFSLTPDQVKTIQAEMVAAGYYGPNGSDKDVNGVVDDATQKGWRALIETSIGAARQGLSFQDVLDNQISARRQDTADKSPVHAPVVDTAQVYEEKSLDPNLLTDAVSKAAQSVLGRSLSKDETDKLGSAINDHYVANQRATNQARSAVGHENAVTNAEATDIATAQRAGQAGNGADRGLSPVQGATVSGRFGEDRGNHTHAGIDLAVPVGTPVVASVGGHVIQVGDTDPNGYGDTVRVRAANGDVFIYAHLSGFADLQPGDDVAAGAVLGQSGGEAGAEGSGDSHGPHLHFEVQRHGVAIDPEPFLKGGTAGTGPANSVGVAGDGTGSAAGGGVQAIITKVANELGVDPKLALAIARQESGFDPHNVGDNGTSFGLYQLHRGGELGDLTPEQAFDPETNARTALTEVAAVAKAHPDWTPGQIAAAAQRPADPNGYAASVNGLYNDPATADGSGRAVLTAPDQTVATTDVSPAADAEAAIRAQHPDEAQAHDVSDVFGTFLKTLKGVVQ